MYHLDDYDYALPESLIAQQPLSRRESSRLLHLQRMDKGWSHRVFSDIVDLLQPDDVLVLNNTKVIPGRLLGHKRTGGKVEVLILDYAKGIRDGVFRCLLKASKRPQPGSRIFFRTGTFRSGSLLQDQMVELAFDGSDRVEQLLETQGHVPLPPYIRRSDTDGDRRTYQTVYATDKGAIAAPTAGLHFSRPLLDQLTAKGVRIAFLTLHVGYGTFITGAGGRYS